MRLVVPLLALALLSLSAPVLADGHGEVQGCKDRSTPCSDADAGTMTCSPESGTAGTFGFVVGMQDEGQFRLLATGTNLGLDRPCEFSVLVDANVIEFNGHGHENGVPLVTSQVLGPEGGITYVSIGTCLAFPQQSCDVATTFGWWRAQHGVTFDVPYWLVVDGVAVAQGEVHYFDPPAIEHVTGGPVVIK